MIYFRYLLIKVILLFYLDYNRFEDKKNQYIILNTSKIELRQQFNIYLGLKFKLEKNKIKIKLIDFNNQYLNNFEYFMDKNNKKYRFIFKNINFFRKIKIKKIIIIFNSFNNVSNNIILIDNFYSKISYFYKFKLNIKKNKKIEIFQNCKYLLKGYKNCILKIENNFFTNKYILIILKNDFYLLNPFNKNKNIKLFINFNSKEDFYMDEILFYEYDLKEKIFLQKEDLKIEINNFSNLIKLNETTGNRYKFTFEPNKIDIPIKGLSYPIKIKFEYEFAENFLINFKTNPSLNNFVYIIPNYLIFTKNEKENYFRIFIKEGTTNFNFYLKDIINIEFENKLNDQNKKELLYQYDYKKISNLEKFKLKEDFLKIKITDIKEFLGKNLKLLINNNKLNLNNNLFLKKRVLQLIENKSIFLNIKDKSNFEFINLKRFFINYRNINEFLSLYSNSKILKNNLYFELENSFEICFIYGNIIFMKLLFKLNIDIYKLCYDQNLTYYYTVKKFFREKINNFNLKIYRNFSKINFDKKFYFKIFKNEFKFINEENFILTIIRDNSNNIKILNGSFYSKLKLKKTFNFIKLKEKPVFYNNNLFVFKNKYYNKLQIPISEKKIIKLENLKIKILEINKNNFSFIIEKINNFLFQNKIIKIQILIFQDDSPFLLLEIKYLNKQNIEIKKIFLKEEIFSNFKIIKSKEKIKNKIIIKINDLKINEIYNIYYGFYFQNKFYFNNKNHLNIITQNFIINK